MPARIQEGDRLPNARVARLIAGDVVSSLLSDLLSGQRAIVIGAPGAFTPVCTRVHLPSFIERAPDLLQSGFDRIVCLSTDSPWAVDRWAADMDPSGRVEFLSDGNFEFGDATGLTARLPDLFLGRRLQRFVLVVNRNVVERVSVERSALDVTCSSVDAMAA